MKLLKYAIISLVILLIGSCDKDNNNDSNYLVFGHFYGECIGDGCVETFKLTDEYLYEDTNNNYSGNDLSFVLMDDNLFLAVKDLTDFFPNQLLEENESILGCPDCADGGGLFIQYFKDGELKSWRIDQMKNDVPEYLHPFMDKVNEKIALINE